MRKRRKARKQKQEEGTAAGVKRDIGQEILDGIREIKAGGGKRVEVSVLDLAQAHTQACREAAAATKKPVVGGNFKKKIWSDTVAVHPSQIPEAMEYNKTHGSPNVEYDKYGRPAFGSAREAREYAKKHGLRHYNFDGG